MIPPHRLQAEPTDICSIPSLDGELQLMTKKRDGLSVPLLVLYEVLQDEVLKELGYNKRNCKSRDGHKPEPALTVSEAFPAGIDPE